MRARSLWLILETVLAFAIPVYFLVMGLFAVPFWLWLGGAANPDSIAMLVSFFAGVPAIVSVVVLLTAAITREPMSGPKFSGLAFLACCGILGMWSTLTGRFQGFDLDALVVIVAVAPTLCTLHLLVLCANQMLLRTRTR